MLSYDELTALGPLRRPKRWLIYLFSLIGKFKHKWEVKNSYYSSLWENLGYGCNKEINEEY